MLLLWILPSHKESAEEQGGVVMANGKSDCCDAHTVQDPTGDVICTACGLIIDNYKKEETENVEKG